MKRYLCHYLLLLLLLMIVFVERGEIAKGEKSKKYDLVYEGKAKRVSIATGVGTILHNIFPLGVKVEDL